MNALEKDVLRAIADDYEGIKTIMNDVRSWNHESALDLSDVVAALKTLVEPGLAMAYELSTTKPARSVAFDIGRVSDSHFYITPEGKEAFDSQSVQN